MQVTFLSHSYTMEVTKLETMVYGCDKENIKFLQKKRYLGKHGVRRRVHDMPIGILLASHKSIKPNLYYVDE